MMNVDKDLCVVCDCALRYALCSRSYVIETVTRFIRDNYDKLMTSTLEGMSRDITEGLLEGAIPEKEHWKSFRRELDNEIEARYC